MLVNTDYHMIVRLLTRGHTLLGRLILLPTVRSEKGKNSGPEGAAYEMIGVLIYPFYC